MKITRAIIFVPDDAERERWEKICLAECDRLGYRVVALVRGGVEKWGDLRRMLTSGEADVLVVARKEHLPPNRVPRTEWVDE